MSDLSARGNFDEQFYIMPRMIFPGIPARTFVTSFVSGAYQERKGCGGAIAITQFKPPQFYLVC